MTHQTLTILQPILDLMLSLADGQTNATSEALPALRAQYRQKLRDVKERLSQSVGEQDSYLLLFPLVVHIDELVQSRILATGGAWSLLQSELYGTEQGGELFFDALDECLASATMDPIIGDIYLFCLRLGFRGKLMGEQTRVEDYVRRLSERLQTRPLPQTEDEPAETGLIRNTIAAGWFYLAAVLVVIVVWMGIQRLADSEQAHLQSDAATTQTEP